jgi:uncharacterized paraquat-inducible protein A
MPEKRSRADTMARMAELAMRNRFDPERLAAVRRAISGKTRCPECDALNRADQETCTRCGAHLYPGHRKEENKHKRKESD